MFCGTGMKNMTELDLGENLDTSNVTTMWGMFHDCGSENLITFDLGDKFNTAKVKIMTNMFYNFGHKLEILDLGDFFYTSEVTNMREMFVGVGKTSMKTLDLGDNFDTSNVTNMSGMFQVFAKSSTVMTSLDLGEKFYTTKVTDMSNMFNGTGAAAMTTLDLGPAFTKIAEGTIQVKDAQGNVTSEYGANDNFITGAGKSGNLTIYAPESIYSDMYNFKLNTDSTTTITLDVVDNTTEPVTYRGTINPKYKPEWSKVSSSLTIDEENINDSTMTLIVKGKVDPTVYANALKTVTSPLVAGVDQTGLINVIVDGELTDQTDIIKTIEEQASGEANTLQYKIVLSNFKEIGRQTGKSYLEWSGNVAVQFAKGALLDAYGNSNMVQIDLNPDDVSIKTPIAIKDETLLNANVEEDKMFADYIRPEFTYKYHESDDYTNPEIDYVLNKVTIVFDVTDKYFESTGLNSDTLAKLITIKIGEAGNQRELIGDTNENGVIDRGEDRNLNGELDEGEDLDGDGEIDYGEDITKTLTKVNDLYHTVNGEEKKIGERYQLVIDGLESEHGVGYSGPMSLGFPADIILDNSENGNLATTITLGIDEDDGDPDTDDSDRDPSIVDVVDPRWIGPTNTNSIDRTDKTVTITFLASDKYYKSDVFAEDFADDGVANSSLSHIKVYVNNTLQNSITKSLVKLTDLELVTLLQTATGIPNKAEVKAGYVLTLGSIGNINGETKVIIDENTLWDFPADNKNKAETIWAGNIKWVENYYGEEDDLAVDTDEDGVLDAKDNTPHLDEDNSLTPRYVAFRNNIVDFVSPTINYEYSTVKADTDGDGDIDDDDGEVSANPDINYDIKQVTVKFTVNDNYLLDSHFLKTVTSADGSTVQVPDNMTIAIDNTIVYGEGAVEGSQVTATISMSDEDHTDGSAEYTLVVTNLQQSQAQAPDGTTPENGNGINFSGPMTLAFKAGAVEDTSGNKNNPTSITLDTHVNPDIVDVVDPIIRYNSSLAKDSIRINKESKSVELTIRAEDKYLSTLETLSTAEGTVKVKVVDEYGNVVVNDATTVTKDITLGSTIQGSDAKYTLYTIELSQFGTKEGIVSVIIPADVVKDTSGNGNVETELLVGLVDFTKPTWEYVTSSINRNVDANGVRNETGTVTLEVKGTDIYFDKDTYCKDEDGDGVYEIGTNDINVQNAIKVLIGGTENDAINVEIKAKDYIEEEKVLDEATGYSRIFKGIKYTLELSGFGANEDDVTVVIPKDAIKDTTGNGNDETPIDVGNSGWVETVGLFRPTGEAETEDTNNPKYTAFRNDIVDFIKPVIKYQYVADTNPELNRGDEEVYIKFTTTDTNFLSSDLGLEDMKIYIDNMQVYGDGANEATKITAALSNPPTEIEGGLEYTLTLSALELNTILASDIFERHSGVIKIEIAANQIADSSGNKNDATTIIVDNGDGDDEANGVIVDFVNPNIYIDEEKIPTYINWEENYAIVTLRGTDRFYDTSTKLTKEDLTFYELNDDGQYVEITSIQPEKCKIEPVLNAYGYDFAIRIDDFEEEYKMKIVIRAGAKDAEGNVLNGIADTSGNLNDRTEIFVTLDNRKPTWKYVDTDTSAFESDGKISFTVKGQDKFLDISRSGLATANLKVVKDGVVLLDGSKSEDAAKITVNYLGTDEDEISKSYKIDVTGLSEMGTYSLVFAKNTLVDEFDNYSAATTISFSNSAIASNTGNYVNVTYNITPDMETVHTSYAHELMSVNTTGTNFENTKYRPSTIGEIFNNGENPLFAEPMLEPEVDGYTVDRVYAPKSFAGWKASDGTVYGLYDDIPNTVTELTAVWQDATVVFVSASRGDNSYDGTLPNKAVKDLETAYSKLDVDGTATNNIIVIMDAVEYDSDDTLSGNATITSLYAGVDYDVCQIVATLPARHG